MKTWANASQGEIRDVHVCKCKFNRGIPEGGKRMYKLDDKEKINCIKNEDKREISTEFLKKNPRIGKIDVGEERFFAYEKQRAHN